MKNKAGRRDPEMRQTKKGNQWYFGMKAHIGVDARSGVVHSLCTMAANVSDVTAAQMTISSRADRLRGNDVAVSHGAEPPDGIAVVIEAAAAEAGEERGRRRAGR